MFQYFNSTHLSTMMEIPLYLEMNKPPEEVARQAGYLAHSISQHPYRSRFRFTPEKTFRDVFFTDCHAINCTDPSRLTYLHDWLSLPATKAFMTEILFVSVPNPRDVFYIIPQVGETIEQFREGLTQLGVSLDADIRPHYVEGAIAGYPFSYMGKRICVSPYVSDTFIKDFNEWLVLTALESP